MPPGGMGMGGGVGQAIKGLATRQSSGAPGPSRARKKSRARTVGAGEAVATGAPAPPAQTVQPGLGAKGGQDMSQPGVAEQYQQQQQGRFTQEGQGSKFFGQTEGQYRAPGLGEQHLQQSQKQLAAQGQGEQFAQQVAGQLNMKSASEQMNQDPGLGGYYDRAKSRTAGSINDQLAARGSFGSSAGMSQISDAMVGLEAERANREGDFRMQQAQASDQAQMARLGLGGQMAQGGQELMQSRLGLGGQMAGQAQGQMMDRLGQGQQAAGQVDQFGLSQAIAGANVAGQAQDATRQRSQDAFGNMMASGNVGSTILGSGMSQQQAVDRQLWESEQAIAMGIPAEQLRQQQYNNQMGLQVTGAVTQGVGALAEVVGAFMGKG